MMEDILMKEREINLIDMLMNIVMHWRSIVLLMLAGGILAGAFSYMKSSKDIAEQQKMIKVTQEETEKNEEEIEDNWAERLTETQMANVNYVVVQENVLDTLKQQMENSALMQIDSNSVQRADITFYIKSETAEQAYSITAIYESLIGSADMYIYIAAETGEEANRLNDIISEESYVYSGQSSSTENYGGVFKVSVLYYDKQMCEDIAQAIEDYLNDNHDYIAETVGAHELKVAAYSVGAVDSASILDSQNSTKTDIANIELSIAKAKDAFSDEEAEYYAYLKHIFYESKDSEEEIEEIETEELVIGEPSVSKKYVLLGIVGLAFIYACILAVLYIVDNKLKACDSLQELYGISVLGTVPSTTKNKKRRLSFIDDKIAAVQNWGRRNFTADEAANLATVAVRMAARENSMNVICLVGNNLKESSLGLCEKIKAELEGENISVKVLNNILYDAETMNSLEGADGIVLVEKAGSSLYTEVSEELELAKRQNIKVLGGILEC
jgi:hypothetical protein